jgi:hypothetical protein
LVEIAARSQRNRSAGAGAAPERAHDRVIFIILAIVAATTSECEAPTRRLFFNNSNAPEFRTFVATDRVKARMSVPPP